MEDTKETRSFSHKGIDPRVNSQRLQQNTQSKYIVKWDEFLVLSLKVGTRLHP